MIQQSKLSSATAYSTINGNLETIARLFTELYKTVDLSIKTQITWFVRIIPSTENFNECVINIHKTKSTKLLGSDWQASCAKDYSPIQKDFESCLLWNYSSKTPSKVFNKSGPSNILITVINPVYIGTVYQMDRFVLCIRELL